MLMIIFSFLHTFVNSIYKGQVASVAGFSQG